LIFAIDPTHSGCVLRKEKFSFVKFAMLSFSEGKAAAFLFEGNFPDDSANFELFSECKCFFGIGEVNVSEFFVDRFLYLKFLFDYSFIDSFEVLFGEGGTGSLGIFDKLFHGHFLFLFGVVGVSGQHDNGVSQRKKFFSIIVVIVVLTEIRLGKLPNNPFDLLGLTGKSEPGQ
jgi:hypothetical protein